MPRKSNPPKLTIETAPLRPGVLGQMDTVYALWEVYLHLAGWQTPEYVDFNQEERDKFTEIVKAGLLTSYVEICKRDALRSGAPVKDSWLALAAPSDLKLDKPLPPERQEEFRQAVTDIYPTLCRLEVAVESPQRRPASSTAATSLILRQARERTMARAIAKAIKLHKPVEEDGDSGTPPVPPDPFAEVRAFVNSHKMRGRQRQLVEALLNTDHGRVSWETMATLLKIKGHYHGSLKGIKGRANQKLKEISWHIGDEGELDMFLERLTDAAEPTTDQSKKRAQKPFPKRSKTVRRSVEKKGSK